jgi:hypothetical protein
MEKYGLYYTLNSNIDTKKVSKACLLDLKKKIDHLDDEYIKAIILLIIEHAKVNDEFILIKNQNEYFKDEIDLNNLPYGLCQDSNGATHINLKLLPPTLQHIIHNFVKNQSASHSSK